MLVVIALLLGLLVGPACADGIAPGVVAAGSMPDRLLVLVLDDVGEDIREHPLAVTPNLDAFVSTGRTYSEFWAAPSCSPFRAQIMTGRQPWHPDNFVGAAFRPSSTGYELPTAGSLPTAVGDATMRGKWHLAPWVGHDDHPLRTGFLNSSGTPGNLVSAGGHPYWSWVKVVDGVRTSSDIYAPRDTAAEIMTDLWAGRKLVFGAFHSIHPPLHVPPDELHSFGDVSGDDFLMSLAMLEALDTVMGPVLQLAARRGYRVAIVSDNGSSPLIGGGKKTLYESGMNTLLVFGGRGVEPGASDLRVQAADLNATFLALTGVGTTGAGPDSIDFSADVLGIGSVTGREYQRGATWQDPGTDPATAPDLRQAVRDVEWKLIRRLLESGDTEEEFYNLIRDPYEQFDLIPRGLRPRAQAAYDRLVQELPLP